MKAFTKNGKKRDAVLYYCMHAINNKCMVNKNPNNILVQKLANFSQTSQYLLFEILILSSLSSRVCFKCTAHSQCSRHSLPVGWATHGGFCGSSDVSSNSVGSSFKVHAIDRGNNSVVPSHSQCFFRTLLLKWIANTSLKYLRYNTLSAVRLETRSCEAEVKPTWIPVEISIRLPVRPVPAFLWSLDESSPKFVPLCCSHTIE